jgi:hypothetical protein
VEELPPLAPETEARRPYSERGQRRRRTKRGIAFRWGLRVVLVVAVFLAGLVIGRAIEDAPRPGGEQTGVRTLEPSTLAPVETVTITVSGG